MMRVLRHCPKDRLPGGEALWQRLATSAGFAEGTLHVSGIGQMGWSKREIHSRLRPRYGVTLGTYHPWVITVFLYSGCADPDADVQMDSPLLVFAHELHHHRYYLKHGRNYESPVTAAGHWRSPVEQAADRYANRQLRRLGVA